MEKIKVGIIGASGYTGQELLRILVNHPFVEILCLVSEKLDKLSVTSYCPDLLGETNLTFKKEVNKEAEVYFLCLPHGESISYLQKNDWLCGKKIIDLSRDFRLKSSSDTTNSFVYGLPEMNGKNIIAANHIANPGCFATAIQLGVLPLLSNVKPTYFHVNGLTGSTGAGAKLSSTTHFSWRQNNSSVYQAFEHAHNEEIMQTINWQDPLYNPEFVFVPSRGSFTRGIITTILTETKLDVEELYEQYNQYYANSPFVFVVKNEINLKMVVNTNKCLIHLVKKENALLITSVIDNLLKGASGQAVQNMNLMFGLPENMGLKLKAILY